ncbi:methyltransferase domain-containing protein [Mycolicibacterium sp. lyk4-40-TYG-92]|uniref:class I SAM-dependent methyltransferase n=1 Tax=Mycolicibacterium sp. lyk4-40-TYG-92 TaxID=3040295 RepID=UPI00254A0503|nr:methyltransferase domain-containing protein [Mycolicibacterium sp. lyk4-40-TYG-92]
MQSDVQITAVQRAGQALQKIPAAHGVAVLGLQLAGRARRPGQLARYLRAVPPDKRKLSLGAGAMTLPGWLCTDLVPVKPSVMYLDAAKQWPIPSASFRYMLCEHMFEQVPYDVGLRVLREARRVLQPGGVLRLSTPDLNVVRSLPDSTEADVLEYVRWSNRTFGTPAERADMDSPVHTLNRVMRAWGHSYIYDEATLRNALQRSGFQEIRRCGPDMSEHTELLGADRHAALVGDTPNRVESLIVEATV